MREAKWRRAALLVMVVLALALTGCGADKPAGDTAAPGATESGDAAADDAATQDTAADEVADSGAGIPPGREIAEGGGGPVQYTFREEWRRGLAEAAKWRAGAQLISASGDMVNNEGVPSSWRLVFMDGADPAAVLLVDMDPWGSVTETREVSGDDAGSFVTEYTKPIPFDVIDSDQAVALGSEALASAYDLTKTKDPRLGLNYSVLDGSGPWWYYGLFNTSSAEYVSAHVNALTGEMGPIE